MIQLELKGFRQATQHSNKRIFYKKKLNFLPLVASMLRFIKIKHNLFICVVKVGIFGLVGWYCAPEVIYGLEASVHKSSNGLRILWILLSVTCV